MVRRKGRARPRNPSTAASNKETNTNVVVPRNTANRAFTRALQHIKYLRRTVDLLIPKSPFMRLVKEIIADFFPDSEVNRVTPRAFECLQEATEAYMVQFLEDCYFLSAHAKRVTLTRDDMIMMRRLRGRDDVINR